MPSVYASPYSCKSDDAKNKFNAKRIRLDLSNGNFGRFDGLAVNKFMSLFGVYTEMAKQNE